MINNSSSDEVIQIKFMRDQEILRDQEGKRFHVDEDSIGSKYNQSTNQLIMIDWFHDFISPTWCNKK